MTALVLVLLLAYGPALFLLGIGYGRATATREHLARPAAVRTVVAGVQRREPGSKPWAFR